MRKCTGLHARACAEVLGSARAARVPRGASVGTEMGSEMNACTLTQVDGARLAGCGNVGIGSISTPFVVVVAP
eukprot:3708401-Pleurochrysis_carterae.AAC.1